MRESGRKKERERERPTQKAVTFRLQQCELPQFLLKHADSSPARSAESEFCMILRPPAGPIITPLIHFQLYTGRPARELQTTSPRDGPVCPGRVGVAIMHGSCLAGWPANAEYGPAHADLVPLEHFPLRQFGPQVFRVQVATWT